MNKSIFLLLTTLIFSGAVFSFDTNGSNLKTQSLTVPIPTPTPNRANEIILDKEKVCLPLPPGFRPAPGNECTDDKPTVKVSAANSENKQLKYEYTVSGGRVFGEGASVIWDLTGGQPGTYQIRVDISDQATGEKRSETKSIDLVNTTPSCVLCECPQISVDAPTPVVKAGDTIIFSANVSGGSQSEVKYNWTVSGGEIIAGQGTPVITVATNSKTAGKTVKAAIEIGGLDGACEDCRKTASADVSITRPKRGKN